MSEQPPVTLRPGTHDDVDLVFDWANDPVTRKVSFSSAPIPYAGHLAWYNQQLTKDGRNLFIAEAGGEPVAVVRLDASETPGTCIVSINVGPHARGRGVGTRALLAATPVAARLGFDTIDAYIRPSNAASIRVFEKAGYRRTAAEESVLGEDAHKFVLHLDDSHADDENAS